MQNRQKHEIVRDILTVCNGGNIISRIMFHTYITHGQAKLYLAELIEKGLIENDPFNSKMYFSTAKGLECLAGLDSIHEMLSLDVRKAKIIEACRS